jgi:hypothetical protein
MGRVKHIEFLDDNRQLKQSTTSRDPIAFLMGVHCALENAGFSVVQDMDTGEWLAYRDGELTLIFAEKADADGGGDE